MVFPGGITTEMELAERTLKLVAGTPSIVTAVEPNKLVPTIATVLPPPSGPAAGVIDEMAGLAIVVKFKTALLPVNGFTTPLGVLVTGVLIPCS